MTQKFFPLNEQEKSLLTDSLENIKGNLDIFVERFYYHFFQQDSSIRELFKNTDMSNQYKMFHTSLATIISSFEFPEFLYTHINGLAGRHLLYGLKIDHLHHFKVGFLEALHDLLRESFTPELSFTWEKIIDYVLSNFYEMMEDSH